MSLDYCLENIFEARIDVLCYSILCSRRTFLNPFAVIGSKIETDLP